MYTNKCLRNTYNLQAKSRCLSNASGTVFSNKYNIHYFLVSSDIPFVDNEIHLIAYNDESCQVRNIDIFKGLGEIKQMTCLDSFVDTRKKKFVMLCTAGCDAASLNGNMLNSTNQKEVNKKGLNKNNSNQSFAQRATEEKCYVWTGQLNNLDEDTDVDTNTDTEMESEIASKSDKEEQKEEEEHACEKKGGGDRTGEGDKKGKTELSNDTKKMEGEMKNEKVQVNDERKIEKEKNKKNTNINDGRKKLVKVCELKSDRTYYDIKKIAVDNHEKVPKKIVVVDRHGYSYFKKEQQNIHFIQSKTVNAELNYGVLDPHHYNIVAVISDIYLYGYDLKSNETIFSTFTNHKSKLSAVDFNPNIPNIIVTSSYDGFIKLWDLRFLKNPFFSINTHSHWITSIHFNNFHDELVLTTSTDFSVKLHKIEYGGNIHTQEKKTNYQLIKVYKEHEDSVLQGVWSNTDAWIFASISYGGKCVINSVPEKQKYKILL